MQAIYKNSKRFNVLVILGIVLLTIFLLVMFVIGSEKGRNSTRALQIKEYIKVLELYRSDTGKYPNWGTSSSTSAKCLTDQEDNNCWLITDGIGNISEYQLLFDAISPYLNRIPQTELELFIKDGGLYEGIIYQFFDYGDSYQIEYFMEGTDMDCIITGAVATSNKNEDTLCTLRFP